MPNLSFSFDLAALEYLKILCWGISVSGVLENRSVYTHLRINHLKMTNSLEFLYH